MLRLHEEGTLSNRELWLGTDANDPRLVLFKMVMKSLILHRCQRGPLLSVGSNVLSLVVTDGACLRYCLALRELCATGDAYPVFHGCSFLLKFLL